MDFASYYLIIDFLASNLLGPHLFGSCICACTLGDLFFKKKKQKRESRVGYYQRIPSSKKKEGEKEKINKISLLSMVAELSGGCRWAERNLAQLLTHTTSLQLLRRDLLSYGWASHDIFFLIFRETRTAHNPQAKTITIV